ncbi:MAG: DNA polymerase IV, partial [Clostridia bacterium]|nr:DNA polymerase IV [Clostridia bacterium]
GFTVNVGIGENKLCAKMASDFEKPDKVHTLFLSEVPTKMWPLPVGSLLFVGEASTKKLNSFGIYKIGQLANTKIEFLVKHFGNKRSLYMHNFANAIDDSPVVSERPEPKGYSNSVTLEENLFSLKEANKILLALSDAVTGHMRKDGNKAHSISVGIRFLNFKNISHQMSFSEPLSTTSEVYEAAKKLLKELWKDRRPIRLISISLTNLTKRSGCKQLSLFDKPSEKLNIQKNSDERVDKVIDKLRKKYGFSVIKRGGVMNLGLEVGGKFKGELGLKKEGIR